MRRRHLLQLLASSTALLALGCQMTPTPNRPPLAPDPGSIDRNLALHRAFFDALLEAGLASGFQAAAARDGRILFEYHAGHDAPPDRPRRAVTPQTRFDVGSVTKTITATLLLRQVQQGRLSYEDPVRKHLPDFPFDDVTIRHLVTHTSGIPASAAQVWPADAAGLADYRRRVCQTHARPYETGRVSEYWSPGYFLLMLIIEQVAGLTIEQLARTTLFDPLGMGHTTFDKASVADDDFFLPWDPDANAPQQIVRLTPPLGETGLLTTATDLLRFLQAYLPGDSSPLTIEERRIALAEAGPADAPLDRTLVFWLRGETNCHGCFGAGQSPATVGHPAYSGCMISHDPRTGLTAAFVSNGMRLARDFGNYARIQDQFAAMTEST